MNNFRFDKKLLNCILCGSNSIKSNFIDHRGINIDICDDCDFQFMNPQYSDEYLDEYYSQYTSEDNYLDNKELSFHMNDFYLSQIEKFTKPGKLLDIGCGYGQLIESAKSRSWAVTGYDVDKETTMRVANRLGEKIYSGDFLTCDFNEKYDLICMHQVLEHLKDPNAYLEKANNLLEDGGILFIAVPNIKSLSNSLKRFLERINIRRKNIGKYYDTNHHVLYFSPDTLKTILNNHGFSILYKRNGFTANPNQSAIQRFLIRNFTDHIFAKSVFLYIAKKQTGNLIN